MSKCISAKGEYSEHAPGEEEFVCGRCYVVDEEAMRAEIERLRADRPSVTDNARAEQAAQVYAFEKERGASDLHAMRRALAAGRAETATATDEDAVTEVARLIDSCIPDDVPGYRYRYAVKAAEAMAARGLLATARTRPTQTEWAHRLDSGGASVHRTREGAESARERHLQRVPYPVDEPPPPASLGIWRREVTPWTEADQ